MSDTQSKSIKDARKALMVELQVSYARLSANNTNPHSASSKKTPNDEELTDTLVDFVGWPMGKKPPQPTGRYR